MLRSEPANVPFAILSLDQGAETATGTVNEGDALVDKVSGAQASQGGEDDADADESPIAWTVFASQSEFDEAMENSEFYGGIVIPDGFTQTQVAAQAASSRVAVAVAQAQAAATSGDLQDAAAAKDELAQAQEAAQVKPSVQLVIDSAKNTSLAQRLQTSLTSTLKDAGIAVEASTVHDVDLGNSSAGAMLGQLSVAPLLAMSMTGSMIMFLVTRAKKGASRKERAKAFGIQLAYAVGLSLYVALADMFIACVVGGVRQVVFLGAGAVNSDSLCMLVIAAIGLACGAIGILMAKGKRE